MTEKNKKVAMIKSLFESAYAFGRERKNHFLGKSHKGNPIVPDRSVASQTLMIVVAIMSFLTCLTFAIVVIVWQQASNWQKDIASEVTIQVRPVDGYVLADEVQKAKTIASNTPGILSVNAIDEEWSQRLLEPWLGQNFNLQELPVPQMLILELDPERAANLKGLSERLSDSVKGGSLDDHRLWLGRLNSMANTMVIIGFVIMALIITAMVLSVTFATHGAMTSNRDVLEVLHFVGGRDAFIAAEFQRRFLLLGFKGAFFGGSVAIFCAFIMYLWASFSKGTPEADQLTALFGDFNIGFSGYLGAFLLIIIIAGLTAITSRIAVFRYLDKITE